MQKSIFRPTATQLHFGLSVLPTIALVVAIALLVGRFWLQPAPMPVDSPMPISSAIESRWGVRITQIGVTADGGLVDLRYQVLDPDKSMQMISAIETTPKIIDNATGEVMQLEKTMSHKHQQEAGRTYFMLFVNRKGLLKTGSAATVQIGDLEVGPIAVK